MSTRRFTRRHFLWTSATATAGALLAACAPATPTTAPAVEPTAGPKTGGTLTVGTVQQGAIPSWLPWRGLSSAQDYHWVLCMNALIKKDHSTVEYVPDLAESWEISPDGLTYTFHLRQGVKWHDGTPFTAKDVSFTFHAALLPEAGSTASGGLKDVIKGAIDFQEGNAETAEGIKVLDDYTVEFQLAKPYVPIMDQFLMFVVPAHPFEGLGPEEWLTTKFATELPFGTGPFVFKEYIADQHSVFERNDDYFMGVPLLDNAVIRFYGDNSVMMIALQKGEINFVGYLNPNDRDELEEAKSIPGVVAEYQDGFAAMFISITCQDEALADKRFRQAVMYAIDRDLIANEMWGDPKYAVVQPVTGWAPPPGVTLELEEYKYNPEKARALLEEAGWDFDREVAMLWWGTVMPNELPIIQQQLEAVGIKTKLVQSEGAKIMEVFYETGDYEMTFLGGWARKYYPDTQVTGCDRVYPAGYNSMRFCNAEMDELVNQALSTVDDDERNALYARASKIWNEELPWIPLYAPQSLLLVHESVKGWQEHLKGPEGYGTIRYATDIEKWYVEA